MSDDRSWDGTSLQEETRIVQGHAIELLLSLTAFSILLGLLVNLAASWLFQVASKQVVLIIMIACGIIVILTVVVFIPRILTTIKEFHQEMEIAIPLLISKQDVKVIHVEYYDDVTAQLHAALASCSAQERENIAQILQNIYNTTVASAHQESTRLGLELLQFLFAIWVAQDSKKLLGSQSSFRKSREVMELQTSTVAIQWHDLASQVPNNRYLQNSSQGVPQNVVLPIGVKVTLSDIAQQLSGKTRSDRSHTLRQEEITLLKATAGNSEALRIAAIIPFSAYGLPKPNAPHNGLTARCILRNAQDKHLHELACEEEQAATKLNDNGHALQIADWGQSDPVAYYASLYKKLYAGGQQPYLLRAFVRIDGTFYIRQFDFGKNKKHKYRLYAWGKELTRRLARLDIEAFLSILKDDGQKVPHRMF
jgi:hypothetical protein